MRFVVRFVETGTGLERAIATHDGIFDGTDGDGNESESDGNRAKLQSDLGNVAGSSISPKLIANTCVFSIRTVSSIHFARTVNDMNC